ncbi:MAG TPA: hypothetical protein VFB14_05620 [Bryobacteraceae bacterium]|jgi:hypothetical protein|nr:hypothetical protein [Bryobacteraceae bacterium]
MSSGPDVFNPEYYLRVYPDIANAFGQDPAAAAQHYRKHGITEGRSPNPFFMPRYYLRHYPDLINAFDKDNYEAALGHWLNNGIAEGRSGSPIFDVQFYLSAYPDLAQAFGAAGYRQAYQHWLDHGIKEGRHSLPGMQTAPFTASGQLLPQAARVVFSSAPEVLALRDPLTTIDLVAATKVAYLIQKDWQNHPAPSPDAGGGETAAGGSRRRGLFKRRR